MKVAVLDPGFEHAHTHHLTVNLSLGQRLADRGIETTVFAARNVDHEASNTLASKGIHVVPHFETPHDPLRAECLDGDDHDRLEFVLSSEIGSLFETGQISSKDALMFHTGFSFHYAALARALWNLDPRPSEKILLLSLFHVGAHRDAESGAIFVHDPKIFVRYKVAFSLLAKLRERYQLDIELASSCRDSVDALTTLWRVGTVSLHPAVCSRNRPLPEALARSPSENRVLLYLGTARESKGIEFAAALGARLAPQYPEYRFVFHFNDRFSGAARFEHHVSALRQAAERHGNVEILRGTLARDDYDRLVETSQIIMLLHDPDKYRYKTSRVLWDALQGGDKHWVVTQSTWVANELQELGISPTTVLFGDLENSVNRLRGLLTELIDAPDRAPESPSNRWYADRLLRPFGDWIADRLLERHFHRKHGASQRSRPRILVVRTHYSHLSELSTGGFVSYLKSFGLDVDELKVNIGGDLLATSDADKINHFAGLVHSHLHSYQPNSVIAETIVQRNSGRYDIVHFVDAEHTGLLSALARQRLPGLPSPNLIATFHQPKAILESLISEPSWLGAFDVIHLLAPDQSDFIGLHADPHRLVCIPLGIAQSQIDGNSTDMPTSPDFEVIPPKQRGKTIVLTVGAWLRDFELLLATARALESRQDIAFLIVSKNLELDLEGASNVLLFNQGLSDTELQALYRQASLFFLPLEDGAANTALLDAMTYGLPIVSTEIPAIDFYSAGLVSTAPSDPRALAHLIEKTLNEHRNSENRNHVSRALKKRAASLRWDRVARRMFEELYLPLLEGRTLVGERKECTGDPLVHTMEEDA